MSSEKVKRIKNHYNPPQTGHTALQRAAAGGHLDIARLLVTQGASLDHQDELVSVMVVMMVVVLIVTMMMMIAKFLVIQGAGPDHQDELVSVVMIVVVVVIELMMIAKLLVTQGASFDHQNELVRLRRANVDGDGDSDVQKI